MFAMPIEMTAIIDTVKMKCLHLDFIETANRLKMNIAAPLGSQSNAQTWAILRTEWRVTYCVCKQVSDEAAQLYMRFIRQCSPYARRRYCAHHMPHKGASPTRGTG